MIDELNWFECGKGNPYPCLENNRHCFKYALCGFCSKLTHSAKPLTPSSSPLKSGEGSKHKDVGNDEPLSPEGLGMIQGVQHLSCNCPTSPSRHKGSQSFRIIPCDSLKECNFVQAGRLE